MIDFRFSFLFHNQTLNDYLGPEDAKEFCGTLTQNICLRGPTLLSPTRAISNCASYIQATCFESKSRQRSTDDGAIRTKVQLQKPRWGKIINNRVLILRKHIVSRMGRHFPNRWPLSYPNLNKFRNVSLI